MSTASPNIRASSATTRRPVVQGLEPKFAFTSNAASGGGEQRGKIEDEEGGNTIVHQPVNGVIRSPKPQVITDHWTSIYPDIDHDIGKDLLDIRPSHTNKNIR